VRDVILVEFLRLLLWLLVVDGVGTGCVAQNVSSALIFLCDVI
jgi:hypothetical protein